MSRVWDDKCVRTEAKEKLYTEADIRKIINLNYMRKTIGNALHYEKLLLKQLSLYKLDKQRDQRDEDFLSGCLERHALFSNEIPLSSRLTF